MKEKLIAFLKGSAVLTLSNICIKAINFFLLPLYTKYLTPEQLGVSDTITTVTSLIFPILVLGLDSAYSAFYFDKECREHKNKVFSSIFFVLAFTSLVPIIGMFFSKPLSNVIFEDSTYYWIIIIALLSMCCNLWYLPFSLYLRVENKMTAFAIVNVTASLVMIVSNIITVSVIQLEEAALIVSTLIANLVMLALYVLFSKIMPKRTSMDFPLTKKMLKYSIPLIPMVVSTWILTTSDRLILLEFMGELSVGLYGISTRFVNLVNVFTNSIYMAYTTFAFSSKNDKDSKYVYSTVLDVMNLFLTAGIFVVSMFSIEILHLMVDAQYYGAYIILPPLLFAQLLYASNTIVSYGLSFEKKSGLMLFSVTSAAILNLILNILLIPRFGLVAAAMTTWLGYLCMLLLSNYFSQKVYPCPYKVKKLVFFNIIMLGVALFALEKVSFIGRMAIAVCILVVFLFAYIDTIKLLSNVTRKFLGDKNE